MMALTRVAVRRVVGTVAMMRGTARRRATRANFTDVLPASMTSIG
ncbi:MAG: hypothetical protein ACO3RX_07425 [Chthoniobacterales bacterium]